MPHRVALHWFRKDLRLTDNTALHHAAKEAEQVIPVYILSTWKKEHAWTGAKRQHFLCGCLDSLAKNIESLGSRLIFRAGDACDELKKLIKETGAEALYFNRDYDPYGVEMEGRVRALCDDLGTDCRDFKDRVLHEPDEVLTGEGNGYKVYTPYSKNWLDQEKPEPLPRVKSLGSPAAKSLSSLPVPTLDHWKLSGDTSGVIEPGERAARKRMKDFIESETLFHYAKQRDIPSAQGTSRLSQDLRFGLIGIRELYQRCRETAKGAPKAAKNSVETYIKELAWREFYLAILYHHPNVFDEEFNPDYRGMPWPGSDAQYKAWCQGRTGFPIVDAGMRELLHTGFMHNRVRMIVSMFLTKDLHCHWRQGESFFMQHLVDGENASNNGGWQWSAGTGADAAPYFRIQNPWTQTKTYDPEGDYIRQWVPELKDVPAKHFQSPPKDGSSLAKDYPPPIVDHAKERERTLALFKKQRA